MPDALGLLESAQSTASKIPYENIAAGQKSIGLALNAFQAAADTNLKKQALEKQLAAMQADMFYKNQAHELDMEKFGWNQKMDIANLNRQYASQTAEQVYRDKMLQFRGQEVNNKIDKGIGLLDRGTQYSDEVAALNQTETPGSLKWGNGYRAIQLKYQDFLQTPQGDRLNRDYIQWHKSGSMQMSKDADNVKKQIDTTLMLGSRTPGQPWKLGDLGLNQEYHIPSKDSEGNPTVAIAEAPMVNPVTQKPEYKPLTKAQLSAKDADFPGLRYRTINKNALESVKPLYGSFSGIISGDPSKMPDKVTEGKPLDRDTAVKFYNQAGRDPAKATQMAIDAGYDPSVQQ